MNRDSGKYSGQRSIHGGRLYVRNAIYMASLSTIRYNPILKPFYRNLKSTGKPSKVAITAVMRKLIILLNQILKNPDFVLAH
jgi:transposase